MLQDLQTPESGEQERMLCTSCLHPNEPDAKYCQSCGAPLGPTAAWGPWEQTQAEGFAIRQATTTERPRLILVLGVWLLFFPMWIVAALLLFIMTVKDTSWDVEDKYWMVIWLGALALSTALLYRSTANYRRYTLRKTDDPGAASNAG